MKMWLKRRWVLRRVQKFIDTRRARFLFKWENLKRACRRHGIKAPHRITRDELNMELKICKHKLKELEHTAPQLRLEHLLRQRRFALAKGDKAKADAILKIMKEERKPKDDAG